MLSDRILEHAIHKRAFMYDGACECLHLAQGDRMRFHSSEESCWEAHGGTLSARVTYMRRNARDVGKLLPGGTAVRHCDRHKIATSRPSSAARLRVSVSSKVSQAWEVL
jgi:hypothetical protein